MNKKMKKLIFLGAIFVLFAGAVSAADTYSFITVAPGETFTPSSGKSGIPITQTAGVYFNVTVYSVDATTWQLYNDSVVSGGNASMTAAPAVVNFQPQMAPVTQTAGGVQFCAYYPVSVVATNATSQYVSITAQEGDSPSHGFVTVTASTSYIHILSLNNYAITNIATQTAGNPTQITITAYDSANNTVTSFNGQASLTAYYWAGGVTATTVSLGTATFTNGKYLGLFTLTQATTSGQSVYIMCSSAAPAVSTGSNLFAVSPAAFSQLLIAGPGQQFLAGATGNGRAGGSTQTIQQTAGVPFYITVYACDQYWNNVTTASGWVTMTSSDGSYSNSYVAMSGGTANFTITLDMVGPGSQTITANELNITSGTDTIPMTFAGIAGFNFQTINSPQYASTAFWITAAAVDAFGNTITNFNPGANAVNMTAFNNGVQMASGAWAPTTVTFSNGLLERNVIVYNTTNQASLQLSYDSITGTSKIFSVYAGAATKIVVSAPPTATAGTPVQAVVYVTDAHGNTILAGANSNDVIEITSSDSLATIQGAALPQDVDLSTGVGYFNIAFGKQGTDTIYAYDTNATTFITATANVSVGPTTINSVIFGNIVTQTAGSVQSVQITTLDKFGNITPFVGALYIASPFTDYTNPAATTMSLTAGTAYAVTLIAQQQIWAVSFTAANAGQATVNISFHRAMTQTVQIFASDNISDFPVGTPSGHYGWSNSFGITPGSAYQLQILVLGMQDRPGTATGYYGQPTAQPENSTITATVNIVDNWFNLVSSAPTDLLTLTTSDPTNSVPQTDYKNLVAGTLTDGFLYTQTSNNFNIQASDTSETNIKSATSPNIIIYQVNTLGITVPSTDQVAGVPFWITITAYSGYPNVATTFNGTVNLASTTNYSTSLPVLLSYPGGEQVSNQFINGVCIMQIVIYRADSLTTTGQQAEVQATLGAVSDYSSPFNVQPNTINQILIIVDGMTYVPGVPGFYLGYGESWKGYQGNPNVEQAGTPFNIKVYVTDAYYNREYAYSTTNTGDTVGLSSTDPAAIITDVGGLPHNISITGATSGDGFGGLFFDKTMVLKTVGANGYQTISVTDGALQNTTQNIYLRHNNLAGFTIASPASTIAGQNFNIIITAIDAYGNTIDNRNEPVNSNNAFNGTVSLIATGGSNLTNTMYPPQYALSDGTAVAPVQMFKSGTYEIQASSAGSSGTSAGIQIFPSTFSRLLILCSAMAQDNGFFITAPTDPSQFPMFTGMPQTLTVNDSAHTPGGYVFTVYSVDEYGNVTNTSTDNIQLSTNDQYAVPVTITPLSSVNGAAVFYIQFHTAMNGVSVTATDNNNTSIMSFTTPGFPTLPGNPYGLQILAPGQSVAAGSGGINGPIWSNGVVGTTAAEVVGISFTVNVLACDEFGNFTSTAPPDNLEITSSDTALTSIPNQTNPTDVTLNNGAVTFTAKSGQTGTDVLTAADLSNSTMSSHAPPIQTSIPIIQATDIKFNVIVNNVSNVTGQEFTTATAAPQTFAVTVQLVSKATGAVVSGVPENFALSALLSNLSGNGHGTLGITYGQMLGNGVDTWSTTLESYTVSEPIRIEAYDPISNSFTAEYSCIINIGANPDTATFVLTANPPNIQANTSSALKAHLTDGDGNPIKGQTVNFNITQGSGTLSAVSATTSDIYGNYQDAVVNFTGAYVNSKSSIVGWFVTPDGTYKAATVTVSVSLINPIDGVVINYPNPFRAGAEVTNVSWLMTTPNNVDIKIYNLFGDLVYSTSLSASQVANLLQTQGNVVTWQWNGKNNVGQVIGNGGYIMIVSTIIDGAPKKMVRKIAVAK